MRNNLPEGAQPWAKRVNKVLDADKKTISRNEANQRAKNMNLSVGGSRIARIDSAVTALSAAEDRLSDLEGSLEGAVEGIDETLEEAFEYAESIADELEAEKVRVQEALDEAFAAQEGVQGALDAVSNLDSTLTPKVVAAQEAADTATTDLGNIFDTLLVKGEAGNILIRDSKITAPMIVASEELSAKVAQFIEVETGKIAWNNAVGNNAFIKKLVGESAFFDEMLTNKLVVNSGNLLKDTTFDKKWWPASSPFTLLDTGGFSGGTAAQFAPLASEQTLSVTSTRTATNRELLSEIEGGTKVRASVWVKSTTEIPANGIGIYVSRFGVSNTASSIGRNWPTAIAANTWTQVWAECELRDDDTHISGRFISRAANSTGGTVFSDPRVIQMAGTVLIEDGAVTANKILANAVTADKIQANALDGKVITGSTIQTTATANRGIIMNSSEFAAYNASGAKTFSINAASGAVSMVGSLTSGSTITGATITGGTFMQNNPSYARYRTTLETKIAQQSGMPAYAVPGLYLTDTNEQGQFAEITMSQEGPQVYMRTNIGATGHDQVTHTPFAVRLDRQLTAPIRNYTTTMYAESLAVASNDSNKGHDNLFVSTDWINVARTPFQGNWAPGSISWTTVTTGVFVATKTLTLPHAVPLGYRLMVYTFESAGYTFCDIGSVSGTSVIVRILQLNSDSTTALSRIGWAMIPTPL